MKRQIIFPHIHRTSGSSFSEVLLKPNISQEDRIRISGPSLSAIKRASFDRDTRSKRLIYGHVPHGLHRFLPKETSYITFLRDPIDRAISWYYWIKSLERTDLFRRHPLRNYADSVSIKEFYANRRHSNMQTRFLAGIFLGGLYPYIDSNTFDDFILSTAKRHLAQYTCFGLQGRFEESISLFKRTFGWTEQKQSLPRRTTSDRPSVDDLREIGGGVLEELRAHHQLDLELHEYAQELFEERLEQTSSQRSTVAPD